MTNNEVLAIGIFCVSAVILVAIACLYQIGVQPCPSLAC